jgi:hypothetical protein
VSNGIMAGDTTVGGTVHLFADYAPTAGQIFDHWSGDVQVLDDPASSHATLVRPAASVTLTAVFKPAPPPQPTKTTAAGSELWYTAAPNARGLIFLFHGAGQDASAWYTRPEQYAFVRDAVASGFSVASMSSDTVGHWALSPISAANVDVQHVQAAMTTLQTAGVLTPSMPIYGVGTSQGGRFTVRVAGILGFDAIANYVSQGDADSLMMTLMVPTRFNMRTLDTHPLVNNSDAQRYAAALSARGVPAEFQLYDRAPLYPELFTKIPGVSEAASNAIHSALKAGGIVDANGYLTIDPTRQKSVWHALVPSAYSSPPMLGLIQDVLEASFAEHGFFSWANRATLSFFSRIP